MMNKNKFIIPLLLLFLTSFSFSQETPQATEQLSHFKTDFVIPQPQSPFAKPSLITELPIYAFSQDGMISSYIKAGIDTTYSTLDIAIYGMSNEELSSAIVQAHKRGVKVRVIVNQSHLFTSKIDATLKNLIDNKVPVRTLRGAGQYGIMHNKVAIFDSRILLCGSFNWTMRANNSNFENAIFSAEQKHISGFKSYFDWMWSYSQDYSKGPMASFDPSSLTFIPKDPSPSINFNGQYFPSYAFSPNGGIKELIIKAIEKTKVSMKIAIFSFYDDDIYAALKKAKDKGINIQIVADRVQGSQSQVIKKLFENAFDFKWSSGYNSGVMHNKYSVFDNQLLISGSFNYSTSANYYNFENVFLTNNQSYVQGYIEEFNYIYKNARIPTVEEINSINSSSENS